MRAAGNLASPIACPACAYLNAAAARFCSGCGTALTAEPRPPPLTASFGERRLLTVLFADLVGSTALIDQLDPEDVLDLMARYHIVAKQAAERHGGNVHGMFGDGLRFLFGYPSAREDATAAAVRAGLDVVDAVNRIGRDVGLGPGAALQVRVGIATGTVVAAFNADSEPLDDNLVGSPLNLAARLQAFAAPDQVVISEATRRLVGPVFTYHALGSHDLRGFRKPVQLFAVTGEVRGQTRLEQRLRHTRTPMVNRISEQTVLARCWELARAGTPQFVSIYGDAGIGKSRLALTMTEQLAGENHRIMWMQCSSVLRNTALHPHIDLVERISGIEPIDGPAVRLAKLRAYVKHEGEDDEALVLLAAMLSTDDGLQRPGAPMSAQLQKQRTFMLLRRLLARATRQAPVLLVYEDLHWIDPSSREFAIELAHQIKPVPLLVVATLRQETASPWASGNNVTVIRLSRLTSGDSAAIVNSFQNTARLPPSEIQRIVAHTDGVPLFIEEMARMVADASGDMATLVLPETLQDLLVERLDKLGRVKIVAQIGAVIGREFPIPLTAAMLGVTPEALEPQIEALLETGLVERSAQQGTLVFKHALVQDAAYASILRRSRREMHGRVAALLISDAQAVAAASLEPIARHLQAAGEPKEAAKWWLRAGVQAISHGAPSEAVAHLEAGLEGLARLAMGEEREMAELELLAVLGPAQMIRNGPGSPQFGEVQRRAFETVHRLPGLPAQFPVTYGLALHHWGRAEFAPARLLATELVATARDRPSAEHTMAGNNILAMVEYHAGNAGESRRLLQQSVAIYDPGLHQALYERYMMCFGVFGRFYLALASYAIGEGVVAKTVAAEAVELAVQLRQPHLRGFAMLANFTIACFRRDVTTALQWAEECIDFASEQRFPEFVGMAMIVRGWATSRQGDPAAGLQILEQGIDLWRRTGFETWQTWFGVLRSELLLALGCSTEALGELDVQAERSKLNGECQFASLLHSARACVLEQAGATQAAIEAEHERALASADHQAAPGWRFRAGSAYAEWLSRQSRHEKCRCIVVEVLQSLPQGVLPGDLLADWPHSKYSSPDGRSVD